MRHLATVAGGIEPVTKALRRLVSAGHRLHIVFQEYLQAVSEAGARIERHERAMRDALSTWTLAPVVAALQALRGVQLIAAMTLVAEIQDFWRFASPPSAHGLSRSGALRGFERSTSAPRRHHQGRQCAGAARAGQGHAPVPLPRAREPRHRTSPGRAA